MSAEVSCFFLCSDRHWRTKSFNVTHASNIIEDLGPSWKDLGRALKIKEAVLSNIDVENKYEKEKCYAVLTIWERALGTSATIGVFSDALLTIQRKDVADKLGESYFLSHFFSL